MPTDRQTHQQGNCGVVAAVLGIAVVIAASPSFAKLPTKTRGFVVTKFVTPMPESDDACPEGFNVGPNPDVILAKVPPAERERLKRPENLEEYMIIERQRGPLQFDVCDRPRVAPDPGFKIVKSKTAFGMDLDGSDGSTTPHNICPHENFIGPNGERGVDNQWYRVLGCIKGQRKGTFMYEYFDTEMRQGDFTILIEVKDIDDVKNDDAVEVGIYAGADPMMTNSATGAVLTNASLRVHHDPYFHARTRGKIVDGVLSTEPVDVRFKAPAERPQHFFRDARLRLTINPDGTAKGILAGYQSIETGYRAIADFFHSEGPIHGPMQCPGFWFALQRAADAYPDPIGGSCGWISIAYEVDAIPAFVIHPDYAKAKARKQTVRVTESGSWWEKLLASLKRTGT